MSIKKQVLKKHKREGYLPEQVKKWDKEYDTYTILFSIGTVEVMLNELERKTKEQILKEIKDKCPRCEKVKKRLGRNQSNKKTVLEIIELFEENSKKEHP